MPVLLVSGASWTSGYPLEKDLGHRDMAWPRLVANRLNYELVDKSRAGSSNYRIYRKAFDGILAGADLCIVFWASWTRFETGSTYGEKPGRIYQHMPSEPSSGQAFRLFFNGYLQYTDLLRQIIALQHLCQNKLVPCWFIANLDHEHPHLFRDINQDEFNNILRFNPGIFDNNDDQRIAEKLQQVKLLEAEIDWSKFICHSTPDELGIVLPLVDGHPTQLAHEIIADMIVDALSVKSMP